MLQAEQAMRRWIPLVVLPIVFAGCASLTPQQTARLHEAQQFADTVTTGYGVPPVKVRVDDPGEVGRTVYSPSTRSLTIPSAVLDRADVRPTLVNALAGATLGNSPQSTFVDVKEQQEWRYKTNRRSVEIMTKFLDMSVRQAVNYYAEIFIAAGKRPPAYVSREDPNWFTNEKFRAVSPCDQLRDLWSHFAIVDPVPACGVSGK